MPHGHDQQHHNHDHDHDRAQFHVHLRGIVEILSHHLYSGPRVYVRELIQNGRDALVARRLHEPGFHGELEITAGFQAGLVAFRDNGIGLTGEQMHTLLSTVGATSKRGDFEEARSDFLGQFGIGLLSCFLIADRIEVHSRSALAPNAPTLTWTGYGDGTYRITDSAMPLDEPGSIVVLQARPEETEWTTPQRLHRLADEYARYLDARLVLTTPDGRTIIDPPARPWHLAPTELHHFGHAFTGGPILAAVRVSVPVAGVDGVAFIEARDSDGHSRVGDAVYSRGMLVDEHNDQLVPAWATFARLILDAGALAPTASRESLQESRLLADVREELGRQLRHFVDRLAQDGDDVFRRFIDAHGTSLLGMARDDDELLDLVIRRYPFVTSRGAQTLDELFREGAPLTYALSDEEFNALAPIVEAQGGVLLLASVIHHAAVFQRAASRVPHLALRVVDLERIVAELPRPSVHEAPLADRALTAVGAALDGHGMVIEVRAFAPAEVPALVLSAPASQPPADAAWGSFADELSALPHATGRPARLILNAHSAPVQAIAAATDPALRRDAARSLLVLARLMSGHRLTDDDAGHLGASLGALITRAARTSEHHDRDATGGADA